MDGAAGANLGIRVTGNIGDFTLSFSQISLKDQSEIVKKVKSLATNICTDFRRDHTEKIDVINITLSPSGSLGIVLNHAEKETPFLLDDSSDETKAVASKLIQTLQKLNILASTISPKSTSKPTNSKLKTPADLVRQLFRLVRRLIKSYRMIQPIAKQQIQNALNGLTTRGPEFLFVNSSSLFEETLSKIKEKDPKINDLFTDNELEDLLAEECIKMVEEAQKKKKRGFSYSNDERYTLNTIRLMFNLDSTPQRAAASIEALSNIDPIDIPLDSLIYLYVQEQNKTYLKDLWKHYIESMFEKIDLSNKTSETGATTDLLQKYYADLYLEALKSLPEAIKSDLTPLLDRLEKTKSTKEIKDHSESIARALRGKTASTPKLKKSEKLYQKKIRAPVQHFVKKILAEASRSERGFYVIYRYLSGDDLRLLFNPITTTLSTGYLVQNLVNSIVKSLAKDQIHLLSSYNIEQELLLELETVSMLKYGLTPEQLQVIRQQRSYNQKFYDEAQQIDRIHEKTNKIVAESNKPTRLLTLGLFSKEVVDKLDSKHKSSLFSLQQQKDLMRLNGLLPKFQNNKNFKLADHFNEEERREILEILQRSASDSTLKPILEKLVHPATPARCFAKDATIPAFLDRGVLKFILEYIVFAKTDQTDENLSALQAKAEALVAKSKANGAIDPKERLSLREIGIISRSARRVDTDSLLFANDLDLLKLDAFDPEIKRKIDQINTREQSKRSKAILKSIEDLLWPSVQNYYHSGDIMAYTMEKESQWTNKPIEIGTRISSLVTKGLSHGAKLFIKNGEDPEKKAVWASKVWGGFAQEPLELYQLCISDFWEIDLTPLIQKNIQEILQKKYGGRWSDEIKKLYQECESEMNAIATETLSKTAFSIGKGLDAGASNFPIASKLIFNKPIIKLLQKFQLLPEADPNDKFITGILEGKVKSHNRAQERDFEKIYNKFFEKKNFADEMICSEWVSKATLLAMMHLNKKLTKIVSEEVGERCSPAKVLADLEKHKIPDAIKDYLQGIRHWKKDRSITNDAEKTLKKIMKKYGYSEDEIDLTIRIGNKEIFDLPYSRKERLRAIDPGRMITLLIKKHCAKKKPPLPALAAISY